MNQFSGNQPIPVPDMRAALSPPFGQAQQLNHDHVVDTDLARNPFAEHERLRYSLRDEDLEHMHKQLWYAGRKGNISPLHHQKVLRRDIILTERARLHLVWFDRTIYIKRLEDELLNWEYFSKIICGDRIAHQAATGFLLSYLKLIQHPSDLEIAKASGLINNDIHWTSWQMFRNAILHHLVDRDTSDRFEYGELRLGRLNQIYRMKILGLAYFNIHRDYSSYFGDNYMTLVALFALVSVALSAMQVMTSSDGVPAAVEKTSYRFSVSTLVALAASCTVLLTLYVVLYVRNWALTVVRHRISSDQGRTV